MSEYSEYGEQDLDPLTPGPSTSVPDSSHVVAYPLHKAAREGRFEDLKRLLEIRPRDVNRGTFDLVRPLHEACLSGFLDCVLLLLSKGALVNLQNLDGATALCDACFNGNPKIVQTLLDHGANVNPPLLMTTPVHEAVFKGHSECLLLLLDRGAYLDKSDCHIGTPLHVAATRGETKCAEILLQYGANPNLSKNHQAPLHEAARSQNLPLVELLLEHGANVYARNGRGMSAKDLVPTSTSPCKLILQEWEVTPKSLRFFCRQSIRTALTPTRMKHIPTLRLPPSLSDYVAFRARPLMADV